LSQRSHQSGIATTSGFGEFALHLYVCRIVLPAHPSVVFRQQNLLDKGVQLVQVNVGEDGGCHPAVRHAAQRGVPDPVLQISGVEHVAQQAQHPVVLDLLTQPLEHDLSVKPIEALVMDLALRFSTRCATA